MFAFFILIVPSGNCFSQTAFQTTIHSGPSMHCDLDGLYQISDQTYYVPETYVWTGDCQNSGTYATSDIIHLDLSGNFTPTILNRFDFTYDVNKIVKVISGVRIIIQNDTTGDTLVDTALPNYMTQSYSFKKPTVDNYLIAVISTSSSTDTIVKFDSAANLIYKKPYTQDTSTILFSYFPTADSGIYQVRDFKTLASGGIIYKRQIVKYNSSLDSIWFKNMNIESKIYQSPDCHLIFIKQDSTCMKYITTFDDNLDTLYHVNFNDSIYWNVILPVKNRCIVSSSYYFPFTGQIKSTFGKVDSLGNTLWRHQLNPIDTSILGITGFIQTRDEGFLVGGFHDLVQTGALHCFIPTTASVVMKIDSLGVLTKIDEQISNKFNVSIYPNPVTNELHIIPLIAFNHQAKVSIINILGKTVQEHLLTLYGDIAINIESLQSGLYFLRITDEKNEFTGRFVKE